MQKSKKNTHFILIFELWNSFDISVGRDFEIWH